LCEPKPVQSPSISLLVGGMGERGTLRVVAEVADGWNTFLMHEEEYRRKLDVLAGHFKDFRRDLEDIRKQLSISVILGENEAEAEDRVKERAATTGIDEDLVRGRFMATTPERRRAAAVSGDGRRRLLDGCPATRRRAHHGALR
jgi:alkanesulfonate monooxygenase SsuD/methylene tetrahydromethanopterin reductase-like flavin-dependent oxidoreductase (luciferase family)